VIPLQAGAASSDGFFSVSLEGGRWRRWRAGVTGRRWRTAFGRDAVGGAGEFVEAMREDHHEQRIESVEREG